jgi:hypothetical protein
VKRWLIVRTSFEGYHYYPSAPDAVDFLRNLHRHIFHVVAYVEQFHDERDLEYVAFKWWLDGLIGREDWQQDASCETIAGVLMRAIQAEYPGRRVKVEANEDGENGALVESD